MTSRQNDQCPFCLKRNIRNMVRHLAYCASREVCPESKRQKIVTAEELPVKDSIHEDEIEAPGYGIAKATNESDSWMDSEESSTEENQGSEVIVYQTDTEGEDYSNNDVSIEIKNEMDIGQKVSIRDTQHEFEVDILSFCNKIDAPLYAYDELMKILKKHRVLNDIVPGEINSKSTLENNIRRRHEYLKGTKPIMKVATLEDGSRIEVVTFDFVAMLGSLLNDTKCMEDSCLTFPNDNPYCHPFETGVRDEFHTGSWYQNV